MSVIAITNCSFLLFYRPSGYVVPYVKRRGKLIRITRRNAKHFPETKSLAEK